MKYLINFLAVLTWVMGVVIAQGFWSTLFAVLVPFWSYYLVCERLIQIYLTK